MDGPHHKMEPLEYGNLGDVLGQVYGGTSSMMSGTSYGYNDNIVKLEDPPMQRPQLQQYPQHQSGPEPSPHFRARVARKQGIRSEGPVLELFRSPRDEGDAQSTAPKDKSKGKSKGKSNKQKNLDELHSIRAAVVGEPGADGTGSSRKTAGQVVAATTLLLALHWLADEKVMDYGQPGGSSTVG
jgi:hypothetical protein